jgi:hypothetical protein
VHRSTTLSKETTCAVPCTRPVKSALGATAAARLLIGVATTRDSALWMDGKGSGKGRESER